MSIRNISVSWYQFRELAVLYLEEDLLTPFFWQMRARMYLNSSYLNIDTNASIGSIHITMAGIYTLSVLSNQTDNCQQIRRMGTGL